MCATLRYTLRSAFFALAAASVITACDSRPKTYDECMLQASRTGKNDRQFRKLAEDCQQKFRSKE